MNETVGTASQGSTNASDAASQGSASPLVLTFEEFADTRGGSRLLFGEPALAKQPRASDKERTRAARRQWVKDAALADRRAELRREYDELVRVGRVRPPTRVERLVSTARGHDDNEAVQAARRILNTLDVDWRELEVGVRD